MQIPSLRNLPVLALLTVSTIAQDFRPAPSFSANNNPSGGFFRFDLDQNGEEDAIILDYSIGAAVMLNPGLTKPTATVTTVYTPMFGFLNTVYFADMNSDGNTDLVFEEGGLFGAAEMLYVPGDGAGGFGAPVSIVVPAGKVTYTAVGDFNGDGQTDAAYADLPSGGTKKVTILAQNNGVFTPLHTETLTAGIQGLKAGDFNGDAHDDLVWYDNGSLQILAGTPGTFGSPVTKSIQPQLNYGFVRDLDHDGFDDLVLYESSFSGWRMDALFGQASNFFSSPQVVVPSGNSSRCDYVGPFDVDSDGNEDVLCVLRNTPGYTLLRHDGARRFSPRPYQTNMIGGLIDLDQDGDLDQIVGQFPGTGYDRFENLARYGDACSGANGKPRLEVAAAIPGNMAFRLTLRNAAPCSLAQLFLSAGATIGGCGPQIHYGLLIYPGPGTPLFFGITDSAGSISASLPIPASVPDGPYFAQGVVIDMQGALKLTGYALSATGGRAIRIY